MPTEGAASGVGSEEPEPIDDGTVGLDDKDVDYAEGEYVEVPVTDATAVPPYIAFTGLVRLLDRIEEKGGRPPAKIDRFFFGNRSGSVVAGTMQTLRFFQMIDAEKRPTVVLRELVPSATRPERMRALIESHYPDELALARDNGTQAQLESLLTKRGLRAATTTKKAAAFFLQACDYAGISVSDYFTKSRPSPGSGGNRRPNVTKKAAPKKAVPQTPQQAASPDGKVGLDLDEKRSRYIDLLLELAAKEKGGQNEALLKRLDRILSLDGPEEVSSG